jgi:hypothetical protein
MKNVIFHDQFRALKGEIQKRTEYGCELLVDAEQDPSGPSFARGSVLHINLLDENTNRSESIAVELDGIRRVGTHWVYRLVWAA